MSKANLQADLLRTQYIIDKCRDYIYAQNLYAAMCNNIFVKDTEEWSCSWRYAGEIVAHIRNIGEDYMDFYCSGIGTGRIKGYVSESIVTSEINKDILNLGWQIKPYDTDTRVPK
jgi:hypothetical protein